MILQSNHGFNSDFMPLVQTSMKTSVLSGGDGRPLFNTSKILRRTAMEWQEKALDYEQQRPINAFGKVTRSD